MSFLTGNEWNFSALKLETHPCGGQKSFNQKPNAQSLSGGVLDGQKFVGFAISIGLLLYNFYLAHFTDLFAHQAWRWEVWHEFSRGQRPSCFKAPLLGAVVIDGCANWKAWLILQPCW